MGNVRFYNMNGINCWIINLKPFGKDNSAEEIRSLQEDCLKECVFGIGWWTEYFDNKPKLTLNEETKEEYKKICERFDNRSSAKEAVEQMSCIKCGDLVIMRLRDGHIYMGKVTETAFHDNTILRSSDPKRISWMCRVEKWLEFGDYNKIPSEILGRFSQRQQSTITRIAGYKQRLLMIAMYEKKCNGKTDVPKVVLNENNFARALDYKDLEDLVCSYIHGIHYEDGYMLLPSSGKVSRQKYEFTFVSNKSDKKPITCQVKNQNSEPINAADYEKDKDIYEKIYLFSGNDNFINREFVKDNIEIISSKNLFDVLSSGKLGYMYKKLSEYHTFSSNIDLKNIYARLNQKGWQIRKTFKGNENDFKRCKVWKDNNDEIGWISFGYNGFYITNEFDMFIIDWENEIAEKIKKALETDLEFDKL